MIILDRLVALAIAALTLVVGSFVSDTIDTESVDVETVVQEVSLEAVPPVITWVDSSPTPRSVPEPISSVEIKAKPTTTTTTTTIPLPEGRCSEWYPVAIEAGWEMNQLQKLGRIIMAESSCIHDIANKTYSYGLTQIEWSAHEGWLDSEFGITEREALYDPYTNLLVARWLFDYAEETYGCGWQPWYMSGDWC